MIFQVRRHCQVEDDIVALAKWIARDSRDAAFRFLSSVESTFDDLRWMPGKGSPKHFRNPKLSGIRSWAVRGFPNHLILYDIRRDHVFVYAIVHGRREQLRLLQQRRK